MGLNESTPGDAYASARNRMVDRLEAGGRIETQATASAMRTVPRHAFVPDKLKDEAYADRPLGIGKGQTISAPHMVAMMTDLLVASQGDRILEIGTGCGYHAAVTAEIVGSENVYSVEYHEPLAEKARKALDQTGYGEISIRVGDGNEGWKEHAPFDSAYLTCAPAKIPETIIEQVSDGVVVGPEGSHRQDLIRIYREDGETTDREVHGAVRFVRMRSA